MSEVVKLTSEQLIAECKKRFGDDTSKWAFECPRCGDIATSGDFKPFVSSGFGSELLGQECIGRHLGALSKKYASCEDYMKKGGRGCDWTAYGLFRGPWFIIVADEKTGETREVPAFALAPATLDDLPIDDEIVKS